MKTYRKIVLIFISFAALLSACATGKTLHTEPARVDEGASYDVIYYGGRYKDDLETIAILDKAGDPYTIEPYAPNFNYRIEKNVPGKAAYEAALRWDAGFNPAFNGTVVRSILGPDGSVIGYEIRPIYQAFTYGLSDVLITTYYEQKDGIIRAWIRLHPEIESQRTGGDHDGHGIVP